MLTFFYSSWKYIYLNHIYLADDGWIKVQRGNQIGMVPENYITLVETEQAQYNNNFNETSSSYNEHNNNDFSQQSNYIDYSNDQYSSSLSPPLANNSTSIVPEPAVEYVIALYDFEAVNADELNLKEGDRIAVTSRDDSGWWEGILNGKSGIFPVNYVQPA